MAKWSVLLLTWLVAATVRAETLSVVIEQYEPFAITNERGELTGIGPDIAAELSKLTGYQFDIAMYPLARIRELFALGKADIALAESPPWWDKEVAKGYTFSEPYVHVYEYVYFPAGKVFPCTKPLDLAGKIVGIHHGYYYAAFDSLFKQGTVKVDESNSSHALLRKLLAGETDAIFLDNFEFGFTVRKYGLASSSFERGMQLTDSPVSIMVRNNR
ncbi:MAG: transporter substrate-binding domain-containing protein, partial [Burkholderiales bacterium]|nr:transporter substrate-binding domain-containing protein [Burkholderiales bacterium]